MPYSIVSLESVEKEAKRAADGNESILDACPYPFDTPAGRAFMKAHHEHRIAKEALGLVPKKATA